MSAHKRILICPLNWGLGHATRCIPIIRLLLKNNAQVIIAGDGNSLELLKIEFPQLQFIYLKNFTISYSDKGNMLLKMLASIPKIIKGIVYEHKILKEIIEKNKIDCVISDNRYGLWNKNIKSIFITHQLMIKTPFAEKLLHRTVLFFVKKYDECWIPDVEGKTNLSGDLSHKYPLLKNTFFIGSLSRFESEKQLPVYKYDVMAIVSGPEPERSIFETLIIAQLKQTTIKALVVCGKPKETNTSTNNNIKVVSHLATNEMQNYILQSAVIIARSGYTTVMDMAALGKKVVLVPTPHQTEQEYLAELLMQKKTAFFQHQSSFNLVKALEETLNYNGFKSFEPTNLLEKRIKLL